MASVADARPAASAAYVVQRGDTLGQIAACSGLSVGELAQLNGISDPDLVPAGELFRLPETHRCAAPRRARKPRASFAAAGSAPPSTLPLVKSARPSVAAVLAEGSRLLTAATARYEAADFEEALSLVDTCAQRLAPYDLDSEADAIRARCHVLAGMAAAGLERRERAIEEFRRAFAIDPSLKLSRQISPRILELVDAAAVEREPSH